MRPLVEVAVAHDFGREKTIGQKTIAHIASVCAIEYHSLCIDYVHGKTKIS